jgi:trehalose-6-phosphatase
MTHLYDIADNYNAAFNAMAAIDDLPEDVMIDTLNAIEDEFKNKAIAVAGYFKNIDADIQAMKDAEKAIKQRRLAKEKHVEWMKGYLLRNMEETGITVIESPYFKISISNNPESVEVIDENLIPAEFINWTSTVNKSAIKQAGGCPGVEIVRNKSIRIK